MERYLVVRVDYYEDGELASSEPMFLCGGVEDLELDYSHEVYRVLDDGTFDRVGTYPPTVTAASLVNTTVLGYWTEDEDIESAYPHILDGWENAKDVPEKVERLFAELEDVERNSNRIWGYDPDTGNTYIYTNSSYLVSDQW